MDNVWRFTADYATTSYPWAGELRTGEFDLREVVRKSAEDATLYTMSRLLRSKHGKCGVGVRVVGRIMETYSRIGQNSRRVLLDMFDVADGKRVPADAARVIVNYLSTELSIIDNADEVKWTKRVCANAVACS